MSQKVVSALTATEMAEVSNPALQKHYDALEALALEEPFDEEGDHEVNDDIAADDETMLRAAEQHIDAFLDLLQQFGELGPSKKKAATKRKRAGAANGGGTASKRRKVSDGGEVDDGGLDWKGLAENDELKSLKNTDLKRYLKAHGLKVGGKKADLVERIRAHVL